MSCCRLHIRLWPRGQNDTCIKGRMKGFVPRHSQNGYRLESYESHLQHTWSTAEFHICQASITHQSCLHYEAEILQYIWQLNAAAHAACPERQFCSAFACLQAKTLHFPALEHISHCHCPCFSHDTLETASNEHICIQCLFCSDRNLLIKHLADFAAQCDTGTDRKLGCLMPGIQSNRLHSGLLFASRQSG